MVKVVLHTVKIFLPIDNIKLKLYYLFIYIYLSRTLEPLALGDEYWNIRDAIVQTELFVLRMVGFQVEGGIEV